MQQCNALDDETRFYEVSLPLTETAVFLLYILLDLWQVLKFHSFMPNTTVTSSGDRGCKVEVVCVMQMAQCSRKSVSLSIFMREVASL